MKNVDREVKRIVIPIAILSLLATIILLVANCCDMVSKNRNEQTAETTIITETLPKPATIET